MRVREEKGMLVSYLSSEGPPWAATNLALLQSHAHLRTSLFAFSLTFSPCQHLENATFHFLLPVEELDRRELKR